MIKIFRDGEDIHYSTARTLQPHGEIIKETRKKAKAVNFGFVYGMYPPKFQAYAKEKFGLDLSLKDATLYRETFFDLYSGLLPWHRRVESFVSINGYIDSVFGRRRRLPEAVLRPRERCPDCHGVSGIDPNCFHCGGDGFISGIGSSPDNEWIRKRACRQGINSPIQSAGSDLNLLIANLIFSPHIRWDFKVDPRRAFMVGSAHDSQIFECHRSYVPELREGINYTLRNLHLVTKKLFNFEFRVPILMDVVAYKNCWEGEVLEN